MTTTKKEPVLVVLQMTGGNDYLNTVIPYTDGMYYDYRPTVGVAEEDVIPIDSTVGLHPEMRPFKDAYDEGDLAIIHGVGYANSPRSHFRSMDIWHTCEPDTLGTEGWLGKVVRSSTRTRRTSSLRSAWAPACSALCPCRASPSRASTTSTATA